LKVDGSSPIVAEVLGQLARSALRYCRRINDRWIHL